MDCGDLSPLFHAKLAEPDFRVLATFIETKQTFGPSWKGEKGARLSKLRLGKAVTSHTQSTGFATPCFPFIPWAIDHTPGVLEKGYFRGLGVLL